MENAMTPSEEREALRSISNLWWLWLVFGIAWSIIGLVVLQFDKASVTTVGIIVGLMFLGAGLQQFVVASIADRLKWLWAIFGVFFVLAGIVALANPEDTFAAVADVLGFLFLLVGAFWVIGAFATRQDNELWWLGLTAGILMIVLAFWTAGQFFIDKAYVLLVFSGIWALLQGVTDVVRAFQVRAVGKMV